VANAADDVLAIAHHVTRNQGGHGAVRELIESILKSQGRWDEVIRRYSGR
jgi:3-deoxy-D-manno-octulosonate 8-phosphate phosphatase (KDO 8-P phosphatase)